MIAEELELFTNGKDCASCGQRLMSATLPKRIEHVWMHVAKQYAHEIFACNICSRCFFSEAEVKAHFGESHPKERHPNFSDHRHMYVDQFQEVWRDCFPNPTSGSYDLNTTNDECSGNPLSAYMQLFAAVGTFYETNNNQAQAGSLTALVCNWCKSSYASDRLKKVSAEEAIEHVVCHMQQENASLPIFQCLHCRDLLSVTNRQQLIDHVRIIHGVLDPMPNFDFVDKLPNYLAEVKIYWARCYELQNDHQEMKTVQKMEDDINDGIVECKECRLMLRKDSKRQPVFLPLENRDAHVRFHLGYRYKRRVSRFETMWERCFGDGIVNDSEEEKTPEPKNQKKQKSKMSKMALEETEDSDEEIEMFAGKGAGNGPRGKFSGKKKRLQSETMEKMQCRQCHHGTTIAKNEWENHARDHAAKIFLRKATYICKICPTRPEFFAATKASMHISFCHQKMSIADVMQVEYEREFTRQEIDDLLLKCFPASENKSKINGVAESD